MPTSEEESTGRMKQVGLLEDSMTDQTKIIFAIAVILWAFPAPITQMGLPLLLIYLILSPDTRWPWKSTKTDSSRT